MKSIAKQTYVFYGILEMLEDSDKIRMQLLSRKFYEKIVPQSLSKVDITKNSSHAKAQDSLYQYASGFIMSRDIKQVCQEAEKGAQTQSKWQIKMAKNLEYQKQHNLDKQLKYGRTIYVPYDRVIVISGNDVQKSNTTPVTDVFQFHLGTSEVEKLPPISQGRTSFAAHYDFLDKFIYIIGGCNEKDTMISACEKFDIFNHKWHSMPEMNKPRGNPGTFITNDRRYLYAFQGFVNQNNPDMPLRVKHSEALDTIERLDLTQESLGW